MSRPRRSPIGHGHSYSQDSVERALTHHLGQGGSTGWTLDETKGHYLVPVGTGLLRLTTLKEAFIFVVGLREKEVRQQRESTR